MIIKRIMLKIAYVDGQRLGIKNYDKSLHVGKLFCGEGHHLIAKCGEIKQHHFCHAPGEGADCASAEGKTSWHCWWQERILPKFLEFRIEKEFLKIADSIAVVGDYLYIIEFQNSVMSKKEMALREKFYTRKDLLSKWGVPVCDSKLFWIFNMDSCDMEIEHVFGDIICFRWVNGTKYMLHAKAPTYLDYGKKDLIEFLGVHKIQTQSPYLIGRIVSLETVDKLLFSNILDPDTIEHRQNSLPIVLPYHLRGDKNDKSYSLDNIKKFYFDNSLQKHEV